MASDAKSNQTNPRPVSTNPLDRTVLSLRFNTGIQLGSKTVLSVSCDPAASKASLNHVQAEIRRDPAGFLLRFEHGSKNQVREVFVPYAQVTFAELAVD